MQILIESLRHNALRIGDRNSLVLWDPESNPYASSAVSWRRLERWVQEAAILLRERFDGDRPVAHSVRNSTDDLIFALACQSAGLVESPIEEHGGEAYLQSCLGRLGGNLIDEDSKRQMIARAYQSSEGDHGSCRVAPSDPIGPGRSPEDDAIVLWTSGTSGQPKGVVLSHRSLLSNAMAKLNAVPQSETDHRHTVLSISHAYARTCDIGTWLLSGCSLSIGRGYDGWTDFLDSRVGGLYPLTLCNVVPSLADRIIQSDRVPDSLRLLGCGGAAMSIDQFDQWRALGVTIIQGYGLTEAGPVIASQTPDDSIAGYVGRVVNGWEYRIEQERLFVRGEHQMSRYLEAPQETSQRIDEDGWLDTGDLVQQSTETGQLRILGRSDDRIVLSNGYKIDPAAVEQRLSAIANVLSAVIQIDQERRVRWWIETADRSSVPREAFEIAASLPKWEQPTTIKTFRLSDSDRTRLLSRKGTVRRAELLSRLRTETQDHEIRSTN